MPRDRHSGRDRRSPYTRTVETLETMTEAMGKPREGQTVIHPRTMAPPAKTDSAISEPDDHEPERDQYPSGSATI